MPERHIELAHRWNVILIEYDILKVQPLFLQQYHPSSLRWILFNYYLAKNPELFTQYKRVVFADVRDTTFQSDPFDLMPQSNGIFKAFGENGGLAIRDCGWNGGWRGRRGRIA